MLFRSRTKTTAAGAEIIPGSEFIEPFDMVIKAVGQHTQADALRKMLPKLETDRRGAIQYDRATGQTNLPRLFAGGDCANGGREVVNAVAEGKKAARGIHALFTGQKLTGPVQPSRHGVPGGAVGSGFDAPIRVRELEAPLAKAPRPDGPSHQWHPA